jgi:hypothetical protein
MVAIEGIGWQPTPRPTSATRPAARGFTVPSALPDASQPQEAAAPEAASLGSVLALQELGSEAVADREARRHGQSMLAELAVLQRALLSGGDDTAGLQRLAELVAAVTRAADSQLAAIVSAIVLRVRVELARRQR